MIDSRAKGARVELEFSRLCFDHLGVSCKRNLEQSRSGGHDITGLDGWAPEVKARASSPARAEFIRMWAQTLEQAHAINAKPLLAIKVNRRGWSFYMDAADLRGDIYEPGKSWVQLEPEDFFQFARGVMPCAPTSF